MADRPSHSQSTHDAVMLAGCTRMAQAGYLAVAFGGFDDTADAPLVYRGSHILPDDAEERGGELQFASIDGCIGDRTREPLDPDVCQDRRWPWLRVSTARDDVVLDLRQIQALHAYLGQTLERMGVDLEAEAARRG